MTDLAHTDAAGLTAEERFAVIRQAFLDRLAASGSTRTKLYDVPKRYSDVPTELQVVRHWAEQLAVPLLAIQVAIDDAFLAARERGQLVTSFNYVQPHIVRRIQQRRNPL